jgi:hypothetical protein
MAAALASMGFADARELAKALSQPDGALRAGQEFAEDSSSGSESSSDSGFVPKKGHKGKRHSKSYAPTPFRIYVQPDEEKGLGVLFDDDLAPQFVFGIPKPFSTKVSYLEEKYTEYYELETGRKPFEGDRIRFKTLDGVLIMPSEIIGLVLDHGEYIVASTSNLQVKERDPEPIEEIVEVEDVGDFLQVGQSINGPLDCISLTKSVTQGLFEYEWVLVLESLPSLPVHDQYSEKRGKFPFSWMGFVRPNKKSAPEQPKPAEGQWLWDGWYSFVHGTQTITYGMDSIWHNGGKFVMKVTLTKASGTGQTLFTILFPETNDVCSPDVSWADVISEMAKKDVELAFLELSSHWKVTLRSFTEK